MIRLITQIKAGLESGLSPVLVTVLKRQGSAPRGAGACMLVFHDGSAQGTIGGGSLEHAAIERAQLCAKTRLSALMKYNLSNSEAGSVGMVCGGSVLMHFWHIERSFLPLFTELCERSEHMLDACLVRVIGKDGETLEARALYKSVFGQAVLSEGDTLTFTEPISTTSRAYVFGGGHVAYELVPLLSRLDFCPVIFDDRKEFANAERFPDALDVIVGDFCDIPKHVSISSRDFAVIMTRGHSYDHALLTQVLRTEAAYIGLIGSRSKVAHTKSLLIAEGFSEKDFERVHTPIGLPILAETPAEIAVSIAAEMIMLRRKRIKALFEYN